MKENSIFEKYIKENRNDIIVYFIVFLVVYSHVNSFI